MSIKYLQYTNLGFIDPKKKTKKELWSYPQDCLKVVRDGDTSWDQMRSVDEAICTAPYASVVYKHFAETKLNFLKCEDHELKL